MKVLRALGFVLAIAVSAAVSADGGYFSKMEREVRPAIPSQKAFLAHKDGQETLIIESALDAPQGDYAWVIPLPDVPTEVKPSTTGALKTVETLTPPKLDGRRRPVSNYLILFAAAAAIIAISAPLRLADKRFRASRLVVEMALAGFVCLALSILLPKYGQSMTLYGEATMDAAKSAGDATEVVEHLRGNVGSYSYSVVSSEGVVDLLDWMKTNGYSLPDSAKPAVESYVEKGWKFFAAKLRHEGGTNRPHPVRLVFPSKEPVYPMALTRAVGGDVVLDLFVVGQGTAKVRGMSVWRAEKLSWDARGYDESGYRDSAAGPGWRPVGHPELVPSFFEGAILTRLHGNFPSRSTSDDLAVTFDPFKTSIVAELVTTAVAVDVAWLWALVGASAALILFGAIVIERMPTPGPMWVVLAVAAVAGVATGTIRYRAIEHVDDFAHLEGRYLAPGVPTREQVIEHARRTRQNGFAQDPEKALSSVSTLHEDVPNGVRVEKTAGGYRVQCYDRYGTPVAYEIKESELGSPEPRNRPGETTGMP